MLFIDPIRLNQCLCKRALGWLWALRKRQEMLVQSTPPLQKGRREGADTVKIKEDRLG